MGGGAPVKAIVKRPTSSELNNRQGQSDAGSSQQVPPKTQKQREEEYNAARERIIGKQPLSTEPAAGPGRGRGFNITNPGRGVLNGRGAAGRGAPPPVAGRGVGGKAVYVDRERELQDPDYRRGISR